MQIASHQTEGYRIQTDLYQGPLDLLLDLIERAELDQYLAYLKNIVDRDAAEVSAFLVIAARLLQIKSAALLPRPSILASTSEEDPAEALAQQLILYRRFKQLSAWLEGRQNEGLHTYLRLSVPVPRFEAQLDLEGITINDLMRAAWDLIAGKEVLPALSEVVSMQRVTIREKILSIMDQLRRSGRISFQGALSSNNRLELVVTFLALLELVKRNIIRAEQTSLFGDIEFEALGELEEIGQEESEFGE
jgi:segregation and condensation protein A